MGCHCLRYMVTPNIDLWHNDNPAEHPFSRTRCNSWQSSQEPFFNKAMLGHIDSKDITRLPPLHYYPSQASSIFRFFTNRVYLGSFEKASWTFYEFCRTRGTFTATVKRDGTEHHTELVCLNARSYRILCSS